MSDFQTADIAELLEDQEEDTLSEDDKALKALQAEDYTLLNDFTNKRGMQTWPEPIRKRFTR